MLYLCHWQGADTECYQQLPQSLSITECNSRLESYEMIVADDDKLPSIMWKGMIDRKLGVNFLVHVPHYLSCSHKKV